MGFACSKHSLSVLKSQISQTIFRSTREKRKYVYIQLQSTAHIVHRNHELWLLRVHRKLIFSMNEAAHFLMSSERELSVFNLEMTSLHWLIPVRKCNVSFVFIWFLVRSFVPHNSAGLLKTKFIIIGILFFLQMLFFTLKKKKISKSF